MTRAEITGELEERKIPKAVADMKYESWRGGNLVAIFGGCVVLLSFALVALPILVMKEIPGMWFLAFASVGGMGGLMLVYIGAHAASGEAMDAAGKSGSRLAKAIATAAAKIRGARNGGTS